MQDLDRQRRIGADAGPPLLAAYLWLLQLDGAGLAWEYLRRNPAYWADWRARQASGAASARRWGLKALDDPALDARSAHPIWSPEPQGAIRLAAAQDGEAFGLWGLPGRKSLAPGQAGLAARLEERRTWRLSLHDDLTDGRPFAFVVAAGEGLAARCRAVEAFQAAIAGAAMVAPRPPAPQLVHMRCLFVLDAIAAGASQREAAGLLFGEAAADAWHADGRERANLRYLLSRGRALRDGGYRALLGHAAPRRRRGRGPAAPGDEGPTAFSP